MSVKSKLAGKLPGSELINGVDLHAARLANRWEREDANNPAAIVVIGVLRVRKVEHISTDDGRVRVPTLEVSRLETLGLLGQDAEEGLDLAPTAIQKLLLDAAEKRTGDTPLPIDAESADDDGIEVD